MKDNVFHAIQDEYADDYSYCYGCGRLNHEGLHLRTGWDGEFTVTHYTPRTEHTAVPGFVYGGLIASLVDCHGTGSAALALHRKNGHEPGDGVEPPRVTKTGLFKTNSTWCRFKSDRERRGNPPEEVSSTG